MEEALRALLLANTALAALVGRRIDWLERPQGKALPAITLQVISAPRRYTFKGRAPTVTRLVQIDIWGSTYATMKAASRAAVTALDEFTTAGFHGVFIEGERETSERRDGPDAAKSTSIFRTSLDVRAVFTDAA